MKTSDIIPIAFRNLSRRKIRTSLTSLAVFIGIFLLTIMISLGLGVRTWLLNMITGQMEYTRITVMQEGSLTGGAFGGMMTGTGTLVGEEELEKKVLSQKVVDEITNIDHITQVQPMLMGIPKSIKIEGQEKEVTGVMGAGFDLVETDAYIKEVLAGNFKDWFKNNNNAIITQHLTDLYGIDPNDTIGKILTIRVVKGGLSVPGPFGQRQGEELIYEQKIVAVIDVGEDQLNFALPLEKQLEITVAKMENKTKEQFLEETGYIMMYVNTDDIENTNKVAERIREMGFDAMTVDDIISMINTIFIVIQAVLAIFGVIALFVASIGIINTMIMSIYERTKEIGVMKAIGAKRGDIRKIFITEAGFIGLLGGTFGVIAGYLGAYGLQIGLNKYLVNIGESTQEFFTFPLYLAIAGLIFAVLVGIIAGFYPASRAAKLDPIDALRYE